MRSPIACGRRGRDPGVLPRAQRIGDDRRAEALRHALSVRVVEPDQGTRGVLLRHRAEHGVLVERGHRFTQRAQRAFDGGQAAFEGGDAHGRRHPQRRTVGQFRAGVGGLGPGGEGARHRSGDADEVDGCARRGQRGRIRPPPQARLADPQVVGQQHPVAVEEDDRPIAALGDRLGTARGDDQRGLGVDAAATGMLAVGDDDPDAGECAAQIIGRALAAR